MEELAVVMLPETSDSLSLEQLKDILIANGLNGKYSISADSLLLTNEEGDFEFNLFDAANDEFGASGPGIDIAGDFEDVAATLIDLMEIFGNAFPESTFSSAYD